MEQLNQSHCEACRIGAPKVTEDEIAQLMSELDGWSIQLRAGVQQLEKSYEFKDFASAMAFANKIGDEAEAEDHHTAITVEWGRVTITWWTHKIGGLHRNDFIMAAKTDQHYS
jgi:4a-hydroxytetrahydrobiopterin dehydratase